MNASTIAGRANFDAGSQWTACTGPAIRNAPSQLQLNESASVGPDIRNAAIHLQLDARNIAGSANLMEASQQLNAVNFQAASQTNTDASAGPLICDAARNVPQGKKWQQNRK